MKKNNTAIGIKAALAFFIASHTSIASVIKLRDYCFCGSGMLSAPI